LLELRLQNKTVLPVLLLRKSFVTELLTAITARSFAFNIAWLQPPAESRQLHGSRAFCIASTTYCFTAQPRSTTAANCHQRYGSKQRGGRPRRWGSVICRSMENSVFRHSRMQLGEAKGFGRPVWRIGVTGRFQQM
jgi:hypothetical protein